MESHLVVHSCADQSGTPAVRLAVDCYREEKVSLENRCGTHDDEDNSKPLRTVEWLSTVINSSDQETEERLPSDHAALKLRKTFLTIGTWNVRTLYQAGKVENLMIEMNRLKVDIMGLAEVRWTGSGLIKYEDYSMIFSGGEKHQLGVGIMMTKKIAGSLIGYTAISERVIVMKLQAKPFNVVCVQTYAPTQTHSDEDVESFYEDLKQARKMAKSQDVVLYLGDWNAKVGSESQGLVCGKFGLGKKNDRGARLISFCEENDLIITNTMFKQHPSRLYTWKSPGDVRRNQIDYILISRCHRNSVKNVCTYPGADINSDHNPVVMKLQLKLKKITRSKPTPKQNFQLLKDGDIRNRYSVCISNRYSQLMEEQPIQEEETVEEKIDKKWSYLKSSISAADEEVLPVIKRVKKQKWMTDKILNLMEERRKLKRNTSEYNLMEREIKRQCKKAKADWYQRQCEEIEQMERNHQIKSLHEKVKQITDRKTGIKNGSGCMKDRDGNMLFEQEEIGKRWIEYISELYDDKDRGDKPVFGCNVGPIFLKSEVENARRKMKDRKACGVDGIRTESIKALQGVSLDILTDLCNEIYQSGYLPDDLSTSVFITLPKKPKAIECTDYRTISLMSHVMKLILQIIIARVDSKIESEISDNQSGFRPGKGTREGIFNLRTIIERYLEVQKIVYICFIDYAKAFDTVYHEDIMDRLEMIGMDENDKRLIGNLYWEQSAVVRLEGDLSSAFPIKRGVRQGCVLSPKLFNLCTERIFRESDELSGCVVGGENVNNLRYADDTVLLAESEVDLQALVKVVKLESEKKGLKMNVKKTKTMVVCRDKNEQHRVSINLNGQVLEQVDKFKYLGQLITDDGRCDQEVKCRIEIARSSFIKMRDVFCSKSIALPLRKRMVRCYVLSTFLYAAESWTLCKELEDRINALELWIYRRMLRVSYKDRITNERIFELVNETPHLLLWVKERKLRYFGHLIRGSGKQRSLLEGKINGTRRRGRQKNTWVKDICSWTKKSYSECVRVAHNRNGWRSMVADLLCEMAPGG